MKDTKKKNVNLRKNKDKVKLYKPRKKKSIDEDAAIQYIQAQYDKIVPEEIKTFKDLPLSQKTLKGLKEAKFIVPTEIQKQSIGFALQGKDILGAAKTGSGKTLAFLIPILEHLFCKKWTRLDGLGALVISPTRELAFQIYGTLRTVGRYHDFSAGLIIGGQNLKFEKKRMDQVNILICTPGRLLQHMDENPLFNCSNLQILILDEADRCLDMGFETTMNAIIENLPQERQTLLFSATQTKSVKDLARLSLSFPTYVAPHDESETCTPEALQQNYIVCEAEDKLSILWSFIKNHLKQKVLVFMSTCKQVKYIYELFCKLRPGVSLIALYGSLHQEKREKIYNEFCRKSNVVLFATDLASRGLDFPHVNWVIQYDCPEDVDTYIHRAGRTARGLYGKGEGLVMLTPHEEIIVDDMKNRKIPIKKIVVDPSKMMAPQRKIEALLSEYSELKLSAQRAFVSYMKSVFVAKNKAIFDMKNINVDNFARSLGLIVPPAVKFIQKYNLKHKSMNNSQDKEDSSLIGKLKQIGDTTEDCSIDKDELKNKSEKIKQKRNEKIDFQQNEDSDDDDFLKVKHSQIDSDDTHEKLETDSNELQSGRKPKKALTKAALAKKILKKKIKVNNMVKYDEDGEAIIDDSKGLLRSELGKEYEKDDTTSGIDIEKAKQLLQEEDIYDKIRFKEKVRAKHKEAKKRLKNADNESEKDEFGSESESDGPDLSWLPDPDKIYNDDDDPHTNSRTSESEEEIEQIHRPPKKRLAVNKGRVQESSKPTKMRKLDEISASLTVNEAEALAIQLLKK